MSEKKYEIILKALNKFAREEGYIDWKSYALKERTHSRHCTRIAEIIFDAAEREAGK